jgi:glycosyltransferase involved in cell wall biosynthesis
MRWMIITGEYVPQPGGVSDYTRLLACGLARCGDEVHVWAPEYEGSQPEDEGVEVHRVSGPFGPAVLRRLSTAIDRMPRPFEILVQYVPHAYGWKAMNLPFCAWLFFHRKERISVMFHEAVFPLAWSQPITHNVLGLVTRVMARIVVRAAERSFVSIPSWQSLLSRMSPRGPVRWLPVPSNMPTVFSTDIRDRLRKQLAPEPGAVVIGHLGTFGRLLKPILMKVLPPLLENPARIGLLIGPGGREFAAELILDFPSLKGRLHSTGGLPNDQIPSWLGTADILVQPYPDGASTRRGTLMAGIALGLPVLSNTGHSTESLWSDYNAIQLAAMPPVETFVQAAEELLKDSARRTIIGKNGAELYRQRFAVIHSIQGLRRQECDVTCVGHEVCPVSDRNN